MWTWPAFCFLQSQQPTAGSCSSQDVHKENVGTHLPPEEQKLLQDNEQNPGHKKWCRVNIQKPALWDYETSEKQSWPVW